MNHWAIFQIEIYKLSAAMCENFNVLMEAYMRAPSGLSNDGIFHIANSHILRKISIYMFKKKTSFEKPIHMQKAMETNKIHFTLHTDLQQTSNFIK